MDEEQEALQGIYADDYSATSPNSCNIKINLSDSFTVTLSLSFPSDYPENSHPFYTIHSDNLPLDFLILEYTSEISSEFDKLWQELKPDVIVYSWVEFLREFLTDVISKHPMSSVNDVPPDTKPLASPSEIVLDYSNGESDSAHVKFDNSHCLIPVISSKEPLIDRKSVFIAHISPVFTVEDTKTVMRQLLTEKKIAKATHNISAYRLASNNTITRRDCDDDGETAAGKRLLHLLEIMDVKNCMAVVSRWYGGIQLGPKRFSHINNVARILLEENKEIWSGIIGDFRNQILGHACVAPVINEDFFASITSIEKHQKPFNFVGRKDILSILSKHFSLTPSSALIFGSPGVGKSTLISKFVSDLRESDSPYTRFLWISFANDFTFQQSIIETSKLLNLPTDDLSVTRDAVFKWLEGNRNYLIILDNTDNTDLVLRCLGGCLISGSTLIKSRNPSIAKLIPIFKSADRMLCLELNVWNEIETREYLNNRIHSHLPTSESELKSLNDILEILDGYPSEIEQMCSFMKSTSRPFSSYYSLITTDDQEREKRELSIGSFHYEQTLEAVIANALDEFKENQQIASCVLLGAIAYVSNKNIPVSTYLKEFFIVAGITSDVKAALSLLAHQSLISFDNDGKTVSIHRAIQNIIRRQLNHRGLTEKPFDEIAVLTITKIFPKRENGIFAPDNGELGKMLLPHINKLRMYANGCWELPPLCYTAASFARFIGSIEVCKELQNHAIEMHCHEVGIHENVKHLLNIMENVEVSQQSCEETLAKYELVYGSAKYESLASVFHILGTTALSLSEYAEAKKFLLMCLSIKQKILRTKEDVTVAEILNILTGIANLLNDNDQARNLYLESLSIFETNFGTRQHPTTISIIYELGMIGIKVKDYPEAKKWLSESLRLKEIKHGTRQHIEIAEIVKMLAIVEEDLGDLDAAKTLYYESLGIYRNVFGTKPDANISEVLTQIGTILKNQGRYKDAKDNILEALAMKRLEYEDKAKREVAYLLVDLGFLYESAGDIENAKKCYVECCEIHKRLLETEAPVYLEVVEHLNALNSNTARKLRFGAFLKIFSIFGKNK
ncbi:hypothetical protein HK098_002180 [Nowakowskiella sp. JEL0407]|nr:hypothetical protein HK098_002180 [Nowakowskiella sp. JEL0407]